MPPKSYARQNGAVKNAKLSTIGLGSETLQHSTDEDTELDDEDRDTDTDDEDTDVDDDDVDEDEDGRHERAVTGGLGAVPRIVPQKSHLLAPVLRFFSTNRPPVSPENLGPITGGGSINGSLAKNPLVRHGLVPPVGNSTLL